MGSSERKGRRKVRGGEDIRGNRKSSRVGKFFQTRGEKGSQRVSVPRLDRPPKKKKGRAVSKTAGDDGLKSHKPLMNLPALQYRSSTGRSERESRIGKGRRSGVNGHDCRAGDHVAHMLGARKSAERPDRKRNFGGKSDLPPDSQLNKSR